VAVLEQVQDDVTTALKAGDRVRVRALRLIASELQKAAKEDSADDGAVPPRVLMRGLAAAEAYRVGGG
jgi:uncharacterized protein YqeY